MKVIEQKGPYSVLGSKEVYQNRWIRVREDNVIHPGGSEGIFGIIEMERGVAVLPATSEEEVFLIKEYKYGAEKELLGIVGGTVEGHETDLEAVKRELKEETGLGANKWVNLGTFHAYENVINSNNLPLYLALDLKQGESSLDENERLTVTKIPIIQAVEMVLDNSISSELSALAILMADKYFQKAKLRFS